MHIIEDYLARLFNQRLKRTRELERRNEEQQGLIQSLLEDKQTLIRELEEASIRQQENESLLDKQKEHIKRLQREILKQLFYKELNLSASERITVFVNQVNADYNGFQAVSRYSSNTDFCNIAKINLLSVYQPMLSLAYQGNEDHLFIDGLPSFISTNNYSRKLYKYCSLNYTPDQLAQMRMKPRSFHFIVLVENGERRGVVMLESAKEKIFDRDRNFEAVMNMQRLLLKIASTPNIYH